MPVKNELNDYTSSIRNSKLKSITFGSNKALMSIENEEIPKVNSNINLKQPYIYEANI